MLESVLAVAPAEAGGFGPRAAPLWAGEPAGVARGSYALDREDPGLHLIPMGRSSPRAWVPINGHGRRVLTWPLIALLLSGGLDPAVAHDTPQPGDPSVSEAPHLAVIRDAPDFTLTDAAGRPVQLSALRGRVVLIAFIYTTCVDACPLLTQRMVLLEQRLQETGLDTETVFLSITVDPERDSTQVLGEYAARFRAASDRWRFLTDAPDRVRRVLNAYDEWTRQPAKGSLDHPARLHLVDSNGRVREIYNLAFFDERQAYFDIRALLNERS